MSKSVLHRFKKLHRTRLQVFKDDQRAIIASRTKINEEFKKNKLVKDEDAITAMIQFAEDVERELRTQVIQAKEVKPGVFEVHITNDTLKIDNEPYNDNAIPKDVQKPCCQDQQNNKQI